MRKSVLVLSFLALFFFAAQANADDSSGQSGGKTGVVGSSQTASSVQADSASVLSLLRAILGGVI